MGATLRLVFVSAGKRITMSYPYAEVTGTGAQVRALMQRIVANKEIFTESPDEIVGAEFAVMTKTPIDIG